MTVSRVTAADATAPAISRAFLTLLGSMMSSFNSCIHCCLKSIYFPFPVNPILSVFFPSLITISACITEIAVPATTSVMLITLLIFSMSILFPPLLLTNLLPWQSSFSDKSRFLEEKSQQHHNDVIDLAGHRDEVRDEIRRESAVESRKNYEYHPHRFLL
jgi:hypothetical protein